MNIRSFPRQSRTTGAGIHKVLGRKFPIVTRDTEPIAESGDLMVTVDDRSEADSLSALLESGASLLLQFPPDADEPDRYISLVETVEFSRLVDNSLHDKRDTSLPWQEVEEPSDDLAVAWPEP